MGAMKYFVTIRRVVDGIAIETRTVVDESQLDDFVMLEKLTPGVILDVEVEVL
jgi:hypothetical protein